MLHSYVSWYHEAAIARCGTSIELDKRMQIFFQFKFFLPDPIKNDVKYQASAQPFLVFGLLTTALAVGSTNAT